MENRKTTTGGVINAVAAILAIFGVFITPEQQDVLLGAAVIVATVGNSIIGISAKDAKD